MEKQDFEKLIEEGLSTSKISERLGISQTNVRYWLKKFELKTKFKIYNKKFDTDPLFRSCPKCKLTLTKEGFYKGYSYCKPCANKQSAESAKLYKRQAVDYKGGKCEICGYNKCIAALEFHHKNPSEKDFTISHRSRSFASMKKELDKCMLVCCRCHREIHSNQMD